MASAGVTSRHFDDSELLHSSLVVATSLPRRSFAKASDAGSLAFSPLAVHFRPRRTAEKSHVAAIRHRVTECVKNVQAMADEHLAQLKSTFEGMLEKALCNERLRSSLEELLSFRLALPVPSQRMAPNPLCSLSFAAILPGDGIAEQVVTSGVTSFLNIYNTLLICRLILTWFPNPPQFIANPLSTICDPYLNLFRGIIPPLGGSLDFSPVLAFLVLNVFTNSAAALPAELPRGTQPSTISSEEMVTLTSRQREMLERAVGPSWKAPSLTGSSGPKLP